MAKKKNDSAAEIDLTTFTWVNAGGDPSGAKPGCGGCHPGGGGLEFDRDGNRFDDHLRANPLLAASPDGDYYDSRWDRSGVLEADCFICHLPGYYFKTRVKNLQRLNFKWASLAASGIGTVSGSVLDGQMPQVSYNTRYFNNDGKIVLNLASPPPSENCVFCHGKADLIKRGFSWDDRANHDVHNLHGMTCTHCHPGDLGHNFQKGDENLSTVRDDLDGTMRNCRECHYQGYMGAPTPKHLKIRPNHVDKLACEVCHIPALNRSAAAGLDLTEGTVAHYTRPDADAVGQVSTWQPDLQADEKGRLFPVNLFAANLYTNLDSDGIYHPLFLREIRRAYDTVRDRMVGDAPDRPLADSEEEIALMLSALEHTLPGNPRFARVKPGYHSRGLVYSLGEGGALVSRADASWANHRKGFNISHNVAPTGMALGSNGCFDCHSDRAHIFSSWISGRLGEKDGKTELAGAGALSSRPWIYYLNEIHEHNYLKPYIVPAVLVAVFLISIFFGDGDGGTDRSCRDRLWAARPVRFERWVHLVRLACFFLLAFTGYLFLYNNLSLMEIFFNTPDAALLFHWGTGFLFAILSLVKIVHWAAEMRGVTIRERRLTGDGRKTGVKRASRPKKTESAKKRWHFLWLSTALSLLMASTGTLMIFRESLGVVLKYGLSIVHASGAMVFLSVIAAHAYLRISAHINLWRLAAEEFYGAKWGRKIEESCQR